MTGSGASRVRLRRSLSARLFSSGPQIFLTLAAAMTVLIVVAAILTRRAHLEFWYYDLIDALLFALWLRGATAWAEADEHGVRWRYWIRHDLPWHRVSRVSLGERDPLTRLLPGGRQPVIWIRTNDGEVEYIRPALGMRRRRRDFGSRLLRLAEQAAVPGEVTGGRWNEPVDRPQVPG
ncbi:MAG: hypothetical protein J2P15_16480 [Micromonosporaceae bacterium]|nr:hypothetical protein [Micromonosporaceae bacterium]